MSKIKTNCCNASLLRWFGILTGVLYGKENLGKGTLICIHCGLPVNENGERIDENGETIKIKKKRNEGES